LEIGCGIGTLTGLVGKFVHQGKLHALDISPESINIARRRCENMKHITFGVSDMSDFESTENFDFIVFPDVLEHIPVDLHQGIFERVVKTLKPDGKIAIHIPDPLQLDLIRTTQPKSLQIIDQSLYMHDFSRSTQNCRLVLDIYERYRLYSNDPDYNWIVFSSFQKLKENTKQNKALLKLKQLYWKYLA
jgi:trans-aconitate methyltransferase